MGRIISLITIVTLFVSINAARAQATQPATPPSTTAPDAREAAAQLIRAGDAAAATKQFDVAAERYQEALKLDPARPAVWVALGDAYNELTPQDADYAVRARAAWEKATEINPTDLPALRRQVAFYKTVCELDSSQEKTFAILRDKAKALVAADPGNLDALVTYNGAVVGSFLAGHEPEQPALDSAIAGLVKLTSDRPADPEPPRLVALAKLRFASAARAAARAAEAERLTAEAKATIDAALAASPTAPMYFAAAQTAQVQELLNPAERTRTIELLDKALAAAADEESRLADIAITAARANFDDRAKSEKILRDVYARRPDDPQVRLALAEHLALSRGASRPEALMILPLPFSAPGMTGPRAYLARDLHGRAIALSANLKLDALAAVPPEQRTPAARADADDTINSLMRLQGASPTYHRLRGKLHRTDGNLPEAIKSLEQSHDLYERNLKRGTIDQIGRWETVDQLAKAYIDAKQSGPAAKLLAQLVAHFPAYEPARFQLAQLLVKDRSLADAQRHIDYLLKTKSNDPEVLKLQLMLQHASGGAEPVDLKLLARLPETTKAQRLDKVETAMVLEQREVGLPLLDKLRAEFPGDPVVTHMAVRVYRALGDHPRSRAVVDEAIAVNPSEPKLHAMKRQLEQPAPATQP